MNRDEQSLFQDLLQCHLSALQAKNASYSLRAFARKLEMPPSALSQILRGRRRVSRKMAQRTVERLCVAPDEAATVLSAFAVGRPRREEVETAKSRELTSDQFRTIAEWHHLAILSLMETTDFESDPGWVARRLGIARRDAERALARLGRLGLVKSDPRGVFVTSGEQVRTTSDVADASIRLSHARHLELAKEALESRGVDEREYLVLTFAGDPDKLEKAKKALRQFCVGKLMPMLEGGEKREVYKLCVQLFPVTGR